LRSEAVRLISCLMQQTRLSNLSPPFAGRG
jgi:hypothetical protein